MVGIYWLHVLIVGLTLGTVGYTHRQNLLAPWPAFCIALTYSFYSDFLVRGYDDDIIGGIPNTDLVKYQLLVLSVYLVGIGTASLQYRTTASRLAPELRDVRTHPGKCEAIAWTLAALDFGKRLFLTEWSFSDTMSQSFGPRGGNPWSSGNALGDGTFIFGLTLILLPASGISFATLLTTRSTTYGCRLRAIIGLTTVSALLFTYGSRTYFAVPILYTCIRYTYSTKSIFRRALAWVGVALLISISFSVIFRYRSNGLRSYIETGQDVDLVTPVYHQDDSYYRILYAAYVAEYSGTRLNAPLFIETVAVNPIPRYIWSSKPALLDDFWGDYKPYFVAITFFGELICLGGIWVALIAGSAFLTCLFAILNSGYSLIGRPLGLGIYFTVLLYVYQCMRSMMSITMSIYFPAGIILISIAMTRSPQTRAWLRILPRRPTRRLDGAHAPAWGRMCDSKF